MANARTRDHYVKIPLSPEENARLRHHSERLHWTQVSILQAAATARLNDLDEQEVFARQARQAAKGTKIGRVPTVNGEEYDRNKPVLGLPALPAGLSSIVARIAQPITKFDEAIGRWVRMVAESEGAFDREARILIVRGAAKEKGATPEQIEEIIKVIYEKLAAREQVSTEKLIKAPPGVPISGDLD